jgi:choline dehydrogenase-like flavoprotein
MREPARIPVGPGPVRISLAAKPTSGAIPPPACRIDFKAASRDGYDVDWPVSYQEIAPYYTRVEELIGVASTVQNQPSNPDGKYLPPIRFRCLDYILEAGAPKLGVHPPCHYCGNCTEGCDVGAFFSSPYFLLPLAHATGNLELRTNAIARHVLVDVEGRAKGVAYAATPKKDVFISNGMRTP